jgi:hypothetical protein
MIAAVLIFVAVVTACSANQAKAASIKSSNDRFVDVVMGLPEMQRVVEVMEQLRPVIGKI